jgi:uncharacterized protein
VKIKWRKWNRIFHRDLGYFFFGMTLIYSISGIAVNHLKEWDPYFKITRTELNLDHPISKSQITPKFLKEIIEPYNPSDSYSKYYFPDDTTAKVFLKKGTAEFYLNSGNVLIETVRKRPIIFETTYLHYDPIKYWTWFSDFFAVGLIIISITGLFIIKGKKGITGRGAWLTALGIIIPIIFLIFLL